MLSITNVKYLKIFLGGWVVNWVDISQQLEVIGSGEFAGMYCFDCTRRIKNKVNMFRGLWNNKQGMKKYFC